MLVTCALCTKDNRNLLPMAIASYLSQDWEEKELLVIDDGDDRVEDLFVDVPGCRYFRLPHGAKNLSVKRNIAARESRGEVIVHFDSDDWSAPTRVRHQVGLLNSRPDLQISGYHTAYFWNELSQEASHYHGQENYSWGPCLCYRRSFALENPWPEHVAWAEDNQFVNVAQRRKQIIAVDGSHQIVVRMHAANQRNAAGKGGDWPFVAKEKLPPQFLELIA